MLAGVTFSLAGPGKKIAGIMPCTVVRLGDMADEILDRELHPEWQGERLRAGLLMADEQETLGGNTSDSGPRSCATTARVARPRPSLKNRQATDGAVFGGPACKINNGLSSLQYAYC